jgi:uncharacterized membrane protein YesL
MGSNRFPEKLYHFFENVMRIVQFQLLWLAFSLCGGVILGIMPATVGLFTVLRKWLSSDLEDYSIIKIFWDVFRKEFWKANTLGLLLFFIGSLMYINFSLLKLANGVFYLFSLIFIAFLSILFFIVLLYIFPVYVHFKVKLIKYFSISILIGISYPLHTFFIAIGYFVIYMLLWTVPGLIPFFCVSLFSLVSMWVSLKVFQRMEQLETESSVNYSSFVKVFFWKKKQTIKQVSRKQMHNE